MFQKQKINIERILPINNNGSSNDSSADISFETSAEAKLYFEELKSKLLTISKWSDYAGGENFVFELTDAAGNLKIDPPLLNDKIRIQLPGPKDGEGVGYDWVEVVRIDEGRFSDIEFYLLEVSPCDCPYQNGDKTAHFYWENATNTFVISMQAQTVQVSIHGRNEVPNISGQNLIEKIRNFVMANTGIIVGSRIQWEIFTDNIMDNK